MSYQAVVTQLTNVRPHGNADRLQLATIHGFQVVVGLDNHDGQRGVFFPCDGQLSEEFATANDLVQRTDPETGLRAGGYFAANRRVRSQRLRGEKSDGFWTTLDALSFTGVDLESLPEGYLFNEINGIPICNKYYTPATLRNIGKGGRARRDLAMFPKHVDTLRFQYEADEWLTPGSIVYITEKLHGTSQRHSLSLETTKKPRRWYHKLFRRDPGDVSNWVFVLGTRNIVLLDSSQGFYEDESFRHRIGDSMRDQIHKGEVIFGEVVGFTNGNSPVMATQSTESLPEVRKQYGDSMTYTYGCIPDQAKFYVYRIIQVNEDGIISELSWPQVKARCLELNLDFVPQLAEPRMIMGEDSVSEIKEIVSREESGASTLDQRHIREGVVLRVERADGRVGFLKSKSFEFGVLEGYIKTQDEYVDLEEIS